MKFLQRANPTTQISIGLALMTCVLVLLANALFGLFVNGDDERARVRRQFGESVAVQGAALLRKGDIDTLSIVMQGLVARDPQLGSMAFRRDDGQVVVQAGDPVRWWQPAAATGTLTSDQLRIPLFAGKSHWGDFELAYREQKNGFLAMLLEQPVLPLAVFVFIAGLLGFRLFMRRVLQHLDPASVIPERVRAAFDTLVEGIAIVDLAGRVVLTNKVFQTFVDGTELVEGTRLASIGLRSIQTDPSMPPDQSMPWVRAMAQSTVLSGEAMQIDMADGVRELQVACSPIHDAQEKVRGCLVSFADVTAVSLANESLRRTLSELQASRTLIEAKNLELERLATRDPLTDCFNRRAFADLGERLISRSVRDAVPIVALLFDIDHFKSINDRFGHAVGDRVIQAIATCLRESLRSHELVARYGGEEFAVLLPGCTPTDAETIANRLRLQFALHCREHFLPEFPGLEATVSVGVSDVAAESTGLHQLLVRADTALYQAKRAGRDRVCLYDPSEQTLVV
jgi:diguanylate cyclase (GGDEF)-like protein